LEREAFSTMEALTQIWNENIKEELKGYLGDAKVIHKEDLILYFYKIFIDEGLTINQINPNTPYGCSLTQVENDFFTNMWKFKANGEYLTQCFDFFNTNDMMNSQLGSSIWALLKLLEESNLDIIE
jgi:hypothetical protein